MNPKCELSPMLKTPHFRQTNHGMSLHVELDNRRQASRRHSRRNQRKCKSRRHWARCWKPTPSVVNVNMLKIVNKPNLTKQPNLT